MDSNERKQLQDLLDWWDDSHIFDWADSAYWKIEELLEADKENSKPERPSPLEEAAAKEFKEGD